MGSRGMGGGIREDVLRGSYHLDLASGPARWGATATFAADFRKRRRLAVEVQDREYRESALLFVDLQRLSCDRENIELFSTWPADDQATFFNRIEKQWQAVCTADRLLTVTVQVLFTVIESLTRDGRDRCLDHKMSNIHVPPGHRGAELMPPLAMQADDIRLTKTSSGVFNSTNIDYILRNMDVRTLIVAGVLTNQCIESVTREAADRGYRVIIAEDLCAGTTAEAHHHSLMNLKGYAHVCSSKQLIAELQEHKK
eukprot:gene31441-6620_t